MTLQAVGCVGWHLVARAIERAAHKNAAGIERVCYGPRARVTAADDGGYDHEYLRLEKLEENACGGSID